MVSRKKRSKSNVAPSPNIYIVILGFAHRNSDALSLRLQTGVDEFFRHPSAWLITTGGYTDEFGVSESQDLASRAIALGVPRSRIIIEDQARNTNENAMFTCRLLANAPTTIMVCTNEFHMPRSLRAFRDEAKKMRRKIAVVPLPAPNGDVSLLRSQTGSSLSQWIAHEKSHIHGKTVKRRKCRFRPNSQTRNSKN